MPSIDDDSPPASRGRYRTGIAIAVQNPAARIGVAIPGAARSSAPCSSSRRSLGGLESADRRSGREGGLAIGITESVRLGRGDPNTGPTVSIDSDQFSGIGRTERSIYRRMLSFETRTAAVPFANRIGGGRSLTFKYEGAATLAMSDIERIERRLSAVERAVVDGDIELDELVDIASVTNALEDLTARFEEHERRIAALEGRIDALEGVVGNVESVNGAVERRADAAVAAVDRLEYRLDELERAVDETTDLDMGGLKAPTDGDTSGDRTGVSETNGSVLARGERESTGSSSESVDVTEPVSDSPAVERTVSEIVSPAAGGDGESDGTPSVPHADGPENRDASTAPNSRVTASATQAALDSRLSESADRDGVVDDRAGVTGNDGSDGRSSREDDTRERPSDGDDETAAGVLQSLRARLP